MQKAFKPSRLRSRRVSPFLFCYHYASSLFRKEQCVVSMLPFAEFYFFYGKNVHVATGNTRTSAMECMLTCAHSGDSSYNDRYYSYNLYDDCTYKNFMKGEEYVSAPARGKRSPRDEYSDDWDNTWSGHGACIASSLCPPVARALSPSPPLILSLSQEDFLQEY